MADLPIIFSAPMVCALLAGRKTQTRRLLSLRGYRDFSAFGPSDTPGYDWHFRRADGCWCDVTDQRLCELLPYAVGDRLYVRENWKPHSLWAGVKPRDIPRTNVFYFADNRYAPSNTPWVPCIHMPRWASRLTLTVTDVRVQRVNDIGFADTVAEGVQCATCSAMVASACDRQGCFSSKQAFRELWNSLHGDSAWDDNPWVIALTFTVDQRNIDG